MGWPEYTMLTFMVLGLGVALALDGQPKGNHNFVASTIATLIQFALLWFGGFFN